MFKYAHFIIVTLIFTTCFMRYGYAQKKVPEPALKAGYLEKTFSSYFTDDVDFLNLRNHGYNWYLEDFYNEVPARASQFQLNTEEGITIYSGHRKELGTATRKFSRKPGENSKKWVGKAFGGGGYFEAEIKFDPQIVFRKPKSDGWPAFWAMSIEHRAELGSEQWELGGEGFVRFIEIDAMEYLYKHADKKHQYGTNVHHWYGVYRKTCPQRAFCRISIPYKDRAVVLPKETSFNDFHQYGFLWVPATTTKKGYIEFYFDRKPVNKKIQWTKYDPELPISDNNTSSFSLLDTQHIMLLLGSGNDMPMTVRSVSVWQNSNNNNWVTRPD